MSILNTLRFWFIPAESGDFRLERDPADPEKALLTIEEPTARDRDRLLPFLKTAVELKWTESMPAIDLLGKTEVHLAVSLTEAGPVLAEDTEKDGSTWTAVRFTSGKILVVDGTELPTKGEPLAAATIPEPKRGCPAPAHARRRASEVLRTFSTRPQWQTWERAGFMRLVGGTTGKSYRLYHRDEAAVRGLGHVLIDVSTGEEVCVWDDGVPAEEEALGVKLAVEHREPWLRGMAVAFEMRESGLSKSMSKRSWLAVRREQRAWWRAQRMMS